LKTKTIQLNQQQKQIIAAIANTGIGIAAEDLPYLFDRFYRLERDRHNQGSGLGLAIAALIARCHGSEIAVTSQDQLTSFEVILPNDSVC
jgi:two-component system, OmpR family, heavy metal sensor histidine kinase CusS